MRPIREETGTDLFISYSSKDRPFAEQIAQDLIQRGVKVWIDTLEMQVGDSLNKKIQNGISSSGWLAIVLSPHSVSSPWVEKELSAALELELEKQSVFVLPLLYKDCRIPLFLRDKSYADFRHSYEQGLTALLRKIKPALDLEILNALMSGSVPKIKAAFAEIPLEGRNAYEALIKKRLDSSSVPERIAAMTALFAIQNKHLLGSLTHLAGDPSSSIRRYAVFYLGELRLRRALGIVSELMSDQNPDVRAAARDAFKKIPGARE